MFIKLIMLQVSAEKNLTAPKGRHHWATKCNKQGVLQHGEWPLHGYTKQMH